MRTIHGLELQMNTVSCKMSHYDKTTLQPWVVQTNHYVVELEECLWQLGAYDHTF